MPDPLPVAVQQPRPYVTGRTQQSIAAVGLMSSDLQTNAGGAMHQPGIERSRVHSELMFDLGCSTVKVIFTFCGNPRTRLCRRLSEGPDRVSHRIGQTTLKQSPSRIRASLITLAPAADRSPRAVDLVGGGEHLAGRFQAKSILAGPQPTPAGGRGTPPAMG